MVLTRPSLSLEGDLEAVITQVGTPPSGWKSIEVPLFSKLLA
jgi:hypothetical protein